MTEPDELLDDDGDPTDEALDHLRTFTGSAGDMVAYVQSLMHKGRAVVEVFTDDYGRPEKRLTLITGGWSGCEAVVSALHDTMFHIMFWESSFRGGKHTYTVSAAQWDMNLAWGIPGKSTSTERHP